MFFLQEVCPSSTPYIFSSLHSHILMLRQRSQITIFSPSSRITITPTIMAEVTNVQPELPEGTPPNTNVPVQTEEERLKYLDFVHGTALQAVLFASKAYSYAKDNSGPLKTTVESLEGTVKNAVGPVYDKYNRAPVDFLKYVDRKVDESVKNIDSLVPPIVKGVSSRALSAAQSAPETARFVATEVKSSGVIGSAKTAYSKYEPAARELYSKYKPMAGEYASSAWNTLNQLPLVSRAAKAAGPTATYLSEKYNQTVQQTHEKGYAVSSYLPSVPTEKIAKALKVGKEDTAAEQPAAAE